MRRHYLMTALVLLALLTLGCRKPQGTGGRTESQGDSTAAPKDGKVVIPTKDGQPQVKPRPRGNSARSRINLKVKSVHMLQQLGKGYQAESILGPVGGPSQLRNMPLHDAFGKPLKIVYNVDLNRVQNPSEKALAWESDIDSSGKRYVLMADCKTVKYVPDAEFKKMHRVR